MMIPNTQLNKYFIFEINTYYIIKLSWIDKLDLLIYYTLVIIILF